MSETDVNELVELALDQFGDTWHCDNVNFLWVHNHWSVTKDVPKPRKWGKQIRALEKAVRNALTLRNDDDVEKERRAEQQARRTTFDRLEDRGSSSKSKAYTNTKRRSDRENVFRLKQLRLIRRMSL